MSRVVVARERASIHTGITTVVAMMVRARTTRGRSRVDGIASSRHACLDESRLVHDANPDLRGLKNGI
jgi:hypothetical protein